MKRKPAYGRMITSRRFPTRKEAENWSSKQKSDIKSQGQSVKTEIDYNESTQDWSAKIFLKIS